MSALSSTAGWVHGTSEEANDTEVRLQALEKLFEKLQIRILDLESQQGAILQPPTAVMRVFCCGTGENGELGLGPALNSKEVKRPRENILLKNENIVAIAVGGMHTMYLTLDGRVLTHGVGDEGALGRPIIKDPTSSDDNADIYTSSDDASVEAEMSPQECTPMPVAFSERVVIARIAAGDSISIAIDVYGQVWVWGTFKNSDGVNVFPAQATPHRITSITNVLDVAAGANYAIFMTMGGVVYIVGTVLPDVMQGPVKDIDIYFGLAIRVENRAPKAVFAGANHGFILSANGVKGGYVLAFGANGSGQCGVRPGRCSSLRNVTRVSSIQDFDIVAIAAGNYHTLMLAKTGEVLVCGDNRADQLGLGEQFDNIPDKYKIIDESYPGGRAFALSKPSPIASLAGLVKSISCGTHHSMFITTQGRLYTSGLGESYQTGHGDSGEGTTKVPTLIENSVMGRICVLAGGGGATYSVFGGREMSEED